MFFTYILKSYVNGKFYVGSTQDIQDRLSRHNSGRSKATKTGIPWEIVYLEEFDTRSMAMVREMEIKNWKSHDRIEKLIIKYNEMQSV
jgi:putative endonuclease